MSMHSVEKITCVCGRESTFKYYASVNVNVDPNLKRKVLKREINNFRCRQCGYEQELAGRFLYHDMKKRLLVWVLPKSEEPNEKRDIDNASEALKKVMVGLGMSEQTVHGYDELFRVINLEKQKVGRGVPKQAMTEEQKSSSRKRIELRKASLRAKLKRLELERLSSSISEKIKRRQAGETYELTEAERKVLSELRAQIEKMPDKE